MNYAKATLLTAIVAMLAFPGAVAPATGAEHVYLLGENASITVEIHYSDGLATTKFAFAQQGGNTGGPDNRLKPTPECTEWIGTFSQASAFAGADKNVASSSIRIRNGVGAPLEATGTYTDALFNLSIFAGPNGLTGRVITCDQEGDGLLRIILEPVVSVHMPKAQVKATQAALVRLTLEGSS